MGYLPNSAGPGISTLVSTETARVYLASSAVQRGQLVPFTAYDGSQDNDSGHWRQVQAYANNNGFERFWGVATKDVPLGGWATVTVRGIVQVKVEAATATKSGDPAVRTPAAIAVLAPLTCDQSTSTVASNAYKAASGDAMLAQPVNQANTTHLSAGAVGMVWCLFEGLTPQAMA